MKHGKEWQNREEFTDGGEISAKHMGDVFATAPASHLETFASYENKHFLEASTFHSEPHWIPLKSFILLHNVTCVTKSMKIVQNGMNADAFVSFSL